MHKDWFLTSTSLYIYITIDDRKLLKFKGHSERIRSLDNFQNGTSNFLQLRPIHLIDSCSCQNSRKLRLFVTITLSILYCANGTALRHLNILHLFRDLTGFTMSFPRCQKLGPVLPLLRMKHHFDCFITWLDRSEAAEI